LSSTLECVLHLKVELDANEGHRILNPPEWPPRAAGAAPALRFAFGAPLETALNAAFRAHQGTPHLPRQRRYDSPPRDHRVRIAQMAHPCTGSAWLKRRRS